MPQNPQRRQGQFLVALINRLKASVGGLKGGVSQLVIIITPGTYNKFYSRIIEM
jgi:hypothetical protein